MAGAEARGGRAVRDKTRGVRMSQRAVRLGDDSVPCGKCAVMEEGGKRVRDKTTKPDNGVRAVYRPQGYKGRGDRNAQSTRRKKETKRSMGSKRSDSGGQDPPTPHAHKMPSNQAAAHFSRLPERLPEVGRHAWRAVVGLGGDAVASWGVLEDRYYVVV